MRATTTIRVSLETRARLNALARQLGAPAGEVVAELVREADDRALLTSAEEGWNRLSADPQSMAAYRGEADEFHAFDAPLPKY